MKKHNVLSKILFISISIIPINLILNHLIKYGLVVNNYFVFLTVLTVIVVGSGIALLNSKNTELNRASSLFITLLLPLIEINLIYCLFEYESFFVAIPIIVWAIFAILLMNKFAKPYCLKVISATLSCLLIIPVFIVALAVLIFGQMSVNTVLKTVKSPKGTYCAEVINRDQGALGGNTFVQVYNTKFHIDLHFCEFKNTPQQIYQGEWDEYETMNIYWVSDNELIINGKPYLIE